MRKIITNEYQYVDLGLPSGTLWATCNVGANKPSDGGHFLSYGESEPKERYAMLDYNVEIDFSKELVDLDKDSAHLAMGGDWELPTVTQFKELKQYIYFNQQHKFTVKGKIIVYNEYLSNINGNKIYFPLCGFMSDMNLGCEEEASYYWLKDIPTHLGPKHISCFYTTKIGDLTLTSYNGSYGHNVRGVINVNK